MRKRLLALPLAAVLAVLPAGAHAAAERAVACSPPAVAELVDESGKVAGPGVRSLLAERSGYAADVTGGAGGVLYKVTSTADDGAGSLRDALRRVRQSGKPGWIIFDLRLTGQTIHLRKELRLAGNLTLDGRCSAVGITAPATSNILAIRDGGNIIITGLSLFRQQYRELGRRNRDAISIIGGAGPVWIHRNRLSHCGDGCVDAAMTSPPPRPVRVTISHHVFTRHNKVMLAGVLDCAPASPKTGCEERAHTAAGPGRPSIFLTVAHNTFLATSQRHPKVYRQAHAHVFGNTYALGATTYEDGRRSAVYGIGVDKGGTALVENNVFRLAPGTSRGVAVLNVGSGCAVMRNNRFAKGVIPYLDRATGARRPADCPLPATPPAVRPGAGNDADNTPAPGQ